ncbi:MAG: NUDIX hydrolase [Candidatus Kapaibacteriota bacterium]|jgi:8-oxo-dGTP pyrophosphatase MutT (NUDIX family)
MELEFFIDKLKNILISKRLKGMNSHVKMSPKIDGKPYRTLVPAGNPRLSSTLLLLIGEKFKDLKILFTLRSSNVQHHKHQISFPGGHCEGGENEIETALREAREEVGIEPDMVTIIGKLSPLYVPPSDTLIIPIVGYTKLLPQLKANTNEVEEIFFHPLNYFMDFENRKIEKWIIKGNEVYVPLWRIHPSVPLWGATAMILSEFIDIVEEIVE